MAMRAQSRVLHQVVTPPLRNVLAGLLYSTILNGHSGIKSAKRGTARGAVRFHAGEESSGDYAMRKIVLTLAALAAVGFVVPMTTSAKAEDTKVVIKHRGERHHMDRGYHRGWEHAHNKKVVIIKHGRRHHND
jgi:hypothetical protein